MVRRILQSLSAPVRGLHQAAYLLALLTLASQLLALIRDRLFAHQFGAGEILDLYYAAFKIPDVVFALVASLVSAYVLIPRIAKGNADETRALLSHSISFLVVVGGLMCLAISVWAPNVLFALFPTFAHSTHAAEFITLARLLLIQPILLGVSGILSSVTQMQRKFVLFALSPVLYNLGIIFGTVVLYPIYGLPGIGYGVIAGAILHVSMHIPVVIGARLTPRLVFPSPKMVWSIARDSVPRSLSLSMGSIISLLLISLASRVSEGAVSVYTLASNLAAVPLSLIGASYATAAFPVMAQSFHEGKKEEFKATLVAATRHIIFWTSVITVLTVVMRAYLVRVIYGTGAFNWDDTRLTAAVLAILIMGLMAQCIILLCARAFYAAEKSWNPFFVQLADFGISVGSAWGMLQLAKQHDELRYFIEALFRVGDVPGTSVLFVALGATIGQIVMGIVALVTLRSVAPGVAKTLTRPLFEGYGAAILGGAASYGVLTYSGTLLPLTKLSSVFLDAAVAGMVGLIVSGCILSLLENQEFRDLLQSLRKVSRSALRPSGLPTDVS